MELAAKDDASSEGTESSGTEWRHARAQNLRHHHRLLIDAPGDPERQRTLRELLDALPQWSSKTDGDVTLRWLTDKDAQEQVRRLLTSRNVSDSVGSAASQLEQAVSKLGPSADAGDLRSAIKQLNNVKQLTDELRDKEEQAFQHEMRRAELKAKMADRRRDRWFTRDTIAALVGALLLLGFAGVLTLMMFKKEQPSEIITNAFLLILGYFFGQGARGGTKTDS